jgi:hypothetical protein
MTAVKSSILKKMPREIAKFAKGNQCIILITSDECTA